MPFTINDGSLRMQTLPQQRLSGIDGNLLLDIADQTLTGGIELRYNAGNEELAGAEPTITRITPDHLRSPH